MINIEDITIGHAREIAALFNKPTVTVANGKILIGKYAIIRSRNEGVNAGVVSAMDETGIIIKEARRIWYHKPADKLLAWYEGVALSGLSDDSKISAKVPLKVIVEDYSVTVCTEKAEKSIREHKAHAQN